MQFIKRKIDGAIGPLVDRRMESGMHEEGDGHTLVAQISEEIFSSSKDMYSTCNMLGWVGGWVTDDNNAARTQQYLQSTHW